MCKPGSCRLTHEQIVRAEFLRAKGCSWVTIGRDIDCAPNTARFRLNPNLKPKPIGRGPRNCNVVQLDHRPPIDLLIERDRLANQERTLSQLYFGDPLYERSALYQKQKMKEGIWK